MNAILNIIDIIIINLNYTTCLYTRTKNN